MSTSRTGLAAAAAALLCAAAPKAPSPLEQAREAASRGGEAKALSIAIEALKQQLPPDRELFLLAVELLPEQKSANAGALAAVAKARLEKQSDDFAWDLGLCKALRVSARPAEAVPHCRKAQGLEPLAYPPYRELGLTYAALGNQAKAAETFALGADISTASCQARQYLGASQEKSGALKEARKSFTAVLKLAGTDRSIEAGVCKAQAAAGLRRLDRAEAEAKAKVKEPSLPDRERRYTACLGKFRGEVRADRLLDAADTAAGCMKLTPDDPPLAAELAPVLVRLGRYEEGVRQYERAAALNKGDLAGTALLRVKAAETWLKLGDHQKAIAQYRLGAAANPDDLTCLRGLAEQLDARSMFPAALEIYKNILKKAPGDARAKARAEELRTSLLTNDEIMSELRLRRALDPKKVSLQPEDINYFKALRAAEMSGGTEFVRARAVSAVGLFVTTATAQGTRVLFSEAGYRAYVSMATRDAISFFEGQKIGIREIFKLRNRLGEPVFDAAGKLTPEGAVVWRKALDGERSWLLPYEAVPESPQAVQASKDMSDAQANGYREISEPEYLWLLRYTDCPEDVMKKSPIGLKVISDGARVRFMLCYVENSACLNPINRPLPMAIEQYRSGDDDIGANTSTAFFGIGGVKKHRMCENGKLYEAPPPPPPVMTDGK